MRERKKKRCARLCVANAEGGDFTRKVRLPATYLVSGIHGAGRDRCTGQGEQGQAGQGGQGRGAGAAHWVEKRRDAMRGRPRARALAFSDARDARPGGTKRKRARAHALGWGEGGGRARPGTGFEERGRKPRRPPNEARVGGRRASGAAPPPPSPLFPFARPAQQHDPHAAPRQHTFDARTTMSSALLRPTPPYTRATPPTPAAAAAAPRPAAPAAAIAPDARTPTPRPRRSTLRALAPPAASTDELEPEAECSRAVYEATVLHLLQQVRERKGRERRGGGVASPPRPKPPLSPSHRHPPLPRPAPLPPPLLLRTATSSSSAP